MQYEYKTSDDPDGPVFNWEDISGTGTSWSDSCPLCNFQDLPITFPFAGVYQPQMKISLNGFVSFQALGLGSAHESMPEPSEPNAVIAPLWTESEFCFDYSGSIYYDESYDLTHYTVQWQNILANDERIGFEMMMYTNGDIVCQYLHAPSFLNYTCGIENASGTQALQVYTDGGCPPIRDNFAIRFRPIVAPAGTEDLVVSASGSDIVLSWTPLPVSVFYEIYRFDAEAPDSAELIGITTSATFTDRNAVDRASQSFYRVVTNNQER
jgi:hypothetical protein